MHRFFVFLAKHFYLLLLPVFFILHGVSENLFIVNLVDASLLLLLYISLESLFFLLFLIIYRNNVKAAFITFISLAAFLLFGAFHDFIKGIAPGFFSSYSFLLIFLFLSYFSLLFYLKRRSLGRRDILYLNILFSVLIFIDVTSILYQLKNHRKEELAIIQKSKLIKPNVYLLVLDEYAGARQLQETFRFNNNYFLDSLARLGFCIAKNSTSNYSMTPFSMASLLSMSYLKQLKNFDYTDENLAYCYKKIFQSKVVSGFRSIGYQFFNYSIFDFKGQSSSIKKRF